MEKRLAELHMDMRRKDDKIRDLEKEVELLNYMNRMLTIRNHKLEDHFDKEIIHLKDVVRRKKNTIKKLRLRIRSLNATKGIMEAREHQKKIRACSSEFRKNE